MRISLRSPAKTGAKLKANKVIRIMSKYRRIEESSFIIRGHFPVRPSWIAYYGRCPFLFHSTYYMSKFNAPAGIYAILEIVFDFFYFADQIGCFYYFGVGRAAGKNQFFFLRKAFYKA